MIFQVPEADAIDELHAVAAESQALEIRIKDAVRRAHAQGYSQARIAEILGRHRNTVRRWLAE